MSFRAARNKAGYSQSEVAKMLGVDQSAVSMWERGVTLPRAATLVKLAALYCCTIDELFGRDGAGGAEQDSA